MSLNERIMKSQINLFRPSKINKQIGLFLFYVDPETLLNICTNIIQYRNICMSNNDRFWVRYFILWYNIDIRNGTYFENKKIFIQKTIQILKESPHKVMRYGTEYIDFIIVKFKDTHHKEFFLNACKYGKLKWAKYLYYNYEIDIHSCNEYAFKISCCNGRLKIAQWLFDLSLDMKSPIDIHINGEDVFILSCKNGHLNIVKWLFNLSLTINSPININIYDKYPYRLSCSLGHTKLIKWLSTISSE